MHPQKAQTQERRGLAALTLCNEIHKKQMNSIRRGQEEIEDTGRR